MKKLLENIEKIIKDNFKVTGEIDYYTIFEDSIHIRIDEKDLFSSFVDKKFVEHTKQISEKLSNKYSDLIVKKVIYTPSSEIVNYNLDIDFREIILQVDMSKLEKLSHDEYILIEP